jgi:TonB-linked SusC/RagA family outer membrane protein
MQIKTKNILKYSCLITLSALSLNVAIAQQKVNTTTKGIEKSTVIPIKGTIKDAITGKPIAGVNVSIPGYSAGITDDNGNFNINTLYTNATLTVSASGFQNKEVPLRGRTNIIINLYENGYSSFYDQVNLSTGLKTESQVPFAAKSLNVEKSQWELASETPGTYLQGRLAGLYSTRRSGTSNSDATLWLRGFNSLYATNRPLVVVDGMIYETEDYSSELIGNNFNNAFANIDVKDIEDISIIKDGSSLYGTKGANGVILISTTHPVELTTKLDVAVYSGFNQQPQNLPLLGASGYRSYLTQILQTKGLSQNQIQNQPYNNDNPANPDFFTYNNNTNWQDQVMENSYNQNYYMKVTGGDNIARYALSLGYTDNGSVVKNSDFSKYNMRLNGDLNLTPKLTLHANLSFYYNEQNLRNQGNNFTTTSPLYLGLTKAPFLSTNVFAADGAESPNFNGTDIFNVSNPAVLVSDNTVGINRAYRFFGNLHFGYKFNNNLKAVTIAGITYDKGRENFFLPQIGITNDTLSTAIALNRSGSEIQRLYSIFNDTYLDYNKSFNNKNNFTSRLGIRTQTNSAESDFGLGFNSATDDFLSVGAGSTTLRRVGGVLGDWNWVNFYMANNYSIASKYFFALNLAIDGSSRFGKNAQNGAIGIGENKFAFMPSIGAGWLISSEDFMANNQFIDFLKLRASYGITGNDDIGNYAARSTYVSQNLVGVQGLVRGNIGNSTLQWETVKKLNVGLDLAVLKDKLSLTFDVFSNRTSNMVIFESISSFTGFDFVINNSAAMRTNGYEISGNSRVFGKKDVKVDLGFSISQYKNQITSLPSGEFLTQFGGATYITRVGQDANMFYGLTSNGIFTSNAEAAASGLQRRLPNASLVPYQGGDVKFVDLNGDKVIDDADRTVIGNPNPDFIGMFNSAISYKNFSLNAMFNFSVGNDLYNGTRNVLEGMRGFENQTQVVVNRWRADGQITNTPRANWGDPMGNAQFSDRFVEDGSYLRLRTIALSYNIPVKDKLIKGAKIYVTANNLFTVTNYLGYDPEFSANSALFAQGVDTGLIPQVRTFQLGFKLGL